MGTSTWFAKTWFARTRLTSREPRTVEQTLHLILAGIAVMGWTLAYTALTRSQDRVARSESAGTKVSVNLTAEQTTSTMPPSAPPVR
jgi:uncharacterized protein (DUF2267 family)